MVDGSGAGRRVWSRISRYRRLFFAFDGPQPACRARAPTAAARALDVRVARLAVARHHATARV
eukprot:1549275-Prymnesium_polylepis.1